MQTKTIKTRIAGMAIMTVLALGLIGCDGHHDPLDTSMKVGHILCTDGQTRSYEDYAASGKEAIAVVFHVNSDEEVAGAGYAVYLHDLAPEAFADSVGVSQGTSADLTAYDGNENTFALYDTDDVSSPMAMRVFDLWRYGQSAYVPQWHRCDCFMRPRSLSIPTSRLAGATRCPMKPMGAGTGRVQRWRDRKPPKPGSIRWAVEPFRKRPNCKGTR